jgi:hypothetical protein
MLGGCAWRLEAIAVKAANRKIRIWFGLGAEVVLRKAASALSIALIVKAKIIRIRSSGSTHQTSDLAEETDDRTVPCDLTCKPSADRSMQTACGAFCPGGVIRLAPPHRESGKTPQGSLFELWHALCNSPDAKQSLACCGACTIDSRRERFDDQQA